MRTDSTEVLPGHIQQVTSDQAPNVRRHREFRSQQFFHSLRYPEQYIPRLDGFPTPGCGRPTVNTEDQFYRHKQFSRPFLPSTIKHIDRDRHQTISLWRVISLPLVCVHRICHVVATETGISSIFSIAHAWRRASRQFLLSSEFPPHLSPLFSPP